MGEDPAAGGEFSEALTLNRVASAPVWGQRASGRIVPSERRFQGPPGTRRTSPRRKFRRQNKRRELRQSRSVNRYGADDHPDHGPGRILPAPGSHRPSTGGGGPSGPPPILGRALSSFRPGFRRPGVRYCAWRVPWRTIRAGAEWRPQPRRPGPRFSLRSRCSSPLLPPPGRASPRETDHPVGAPAGALRGSIPWVE